jgi:hypothetical protein
MFAFRLFDGDRGRWQPRALFWHEDRCRLLGINGTSRNVRFTALLEHWRIFDRRGVTKDRRKSGRFLAPEYWGEATGAFHLGRDDLLADRFAATKEVVFTYFL